MKLAATVSRYLMGLMFTVFGLNGFLWFLPQRPVPPLATQFVTAMMSSHYMVPIFALQLVCGLLFLANVYIPLALTLIAPVIVNILLYHITMDPATILPGVLVAVLWMLVFVSVRPAFAGILQRRVTSPP